MSKSTTIVATSTIRAAFQGESPALQPAEGVSTDSLFGKGGTAAQPGTVRGRLHPKHVEVYLAANPTHRFGEGAAKPADRTVEVPRTGKNGRALKPVTMPVSEARALAGDAAKGKGRLSSAALVAAGKAYQAAQTSK